MLSLSTEIEATVIHASGQHNNQQHCQLDHVLILHTRQHIHSRPKIPRTVKIFASTLQSNFSRKLAYKHVLAVTAALSMMKDFCEEKMKTFALQYARLHFKGST